MKTRNVKVKADMRIVSSIKGVPLTSAETIERIVPVEQDMINLSVPASTVVVKAICDAAIRMFYVDLFRERLRTDVPLKRFIGSTKWSVDVVSIECEVEKDVQHA